MKFHPFINDVIFYSGTVLGPFKKNKLIINNLLITGYASLVIGQVISLIGNNFKRYSRRILRHFLEVFKRTPILFVVSDQSEPYLWLPNKEKRLSKVVQIIKSRRGNDHLLTDDNHRYRIC